MKPPKILIIDDEASVRNTIALYLTKLDFQFDLAGGGTEGLKMFRENRYDIILCDYQMGEISGLHVAKEIKDSPQPVPIVFMVNYIETTHAYDAISRGEAVDYLLKPIDRNALKIVINRIFQFNEKRAHKKVLKKVEKETIITGPLIGRSLLTRSVNEAIHKSTKNELPVMIFGPECAGIRKIAKLIHNMSSRKTNPYVSVTLRNIPENSVEGELFGYSDSSFKKRGALEKACGGTIFIDSLEKIRPEIQEKLVKAIDELQFENLGAGEIIPLNVRFITYVADIVPQKVINGQFGTLKPDIFYRLNLIPIQIPSLNQRREDIQDIIQHFLDTHEPPLEINPEALELLLKYSWFHDVDHLEMVMMQIMVNADFEIHVHNLPFEIQFQQRNQLNVLMPYTDFNFNELECKVILNALKKFNGNQSRAARYIGVSRQTLIYRMKKYSLKEYFKNSVCDRGEKKSNVKVY